MGSSKTKQSGFSVVEGILIVVVVAVLGFIGWTVYHSYASKPAPKTSKQITNSQTHASSNTKSNPSSQQNAASTNLVTDYFAPASISFAHDKKWTWDTSGETYGYYEHPNEKSAKLNLPYQGPNDTIPSRYTIGFVSDSVPPPTESGMNTFTKLGQVTLGNQTLYILHGYFANEPASWALDMILTSSCPDQQCPFIPTGSNPYFSVSVSKGMQNGVSLDSSMVPEITTILESMQLGKP